MKANKVVRIIFILFIVLGLLISISPYFINNVVEPYYMNHIHSKAKEVSKEEIKQNQEKIKEMQSSGKNKSDAAQNDKDNPYSQISYDPSVIQSLSSVPKFQSVNKHFLVGYIQIPEVNLELPILEGLTNENLNVATGTMKPGQVMGKGNYALAGHHMANENLLFTPLMRVHKGTLVYLTDKDRTYVYEVCDTEVININRGEVINDDEGDKIVTLITCTDIYGTARLMVRGKLLNIIKN